MKGELVEKLEEGLGGGQGEGPAVSTIWGSPHLSSHLVSGKISNTGRASLRRIVFWGEGTLEEGEGGRSHPAALRS